MSNFFLNLGMVLTKIRLLQEYFDRSETESFVVQQLFGADQCFYDAYSWRKILEHCLEWFHNVTVENVVCKFSEGLQNSHQGVF